MKTLNIILVPTALLITHSAMARDPLLTPVDCTLNGVESRVELEKGRNEGRGNLSEEGLEVYRSYSISREYRDEIYTNQIEVYDEEEDDPTAWATGVHDIENGSQLGVIVDGDEIICKF